MLSTIKLDSIERMRALIIDDDIDIRRFLKANLEAESFAVDTAGDGEEGSRMAKNHDYDLILLDNIMPKKRGIDVCRDIRKTGKSSPIIILSVQGEIDDKVELLNAGADDYVTKPFSYKELRSRIEAVLRRPKAVKDYILAIDDLVLDPRKQKVRRGAKDVYLTRKEFALAEYLIRNSGTVVSRGMIMEHVWSDSVNPFSNTIEAHILNIRKKIDVSRKTKLIHTVPGRGYKIECGRGKVFD